MKLNLNAPIGYTGYGIAALNVLKELEKSGVETALWKIGDQRQLQVDSQDDADIVKKCLDRKGFFDYNAPCLKIWHQFELAEHVGRGPYFAWPFFELDRLKPEEQNHIKVPDKVFVTSQWGKEVVEQYRDNVKVVPLGVDTEIFNPSLKGNKSRNAFVVLNAGKWEKRKGHDFIVGVFNAAFTKDDNVELWMLPHNTFLTDPQTAEWTQLYMDAPLGDRTWILPRQTSHKMLAKMLACADLGFFPSRGEGWNLELLEMMALGKTVIATNYSAHTEFCDGENAILIEIDKKEEAQDGKWFFGQGAWASLGEAQFEAAVTALRESYKKWRESPDRLFNGAGVATAERFSWKNSVDKLVENIYEEELSEVVQN